MILAFGKTDQVTRELRFQWNVKILDHKETILSNLKASSDTIQKRRPKAVINSAINKEVGKAETEKSLLTVLNRKDPGNLGTELLDEIFCQAKKYVTIIPKRNVDFPASDLLTFGSGLNYISVEESINISQPFLESILNTILE